MLHAKEAKEISKKNLKTLKDVENSITVMAENGHRYAAFELDKFDLSEDDFNKIREAGYTIEYIMEGHIRITW
jgi:hypothetical protein